MARPRIVIALGGNALLKRGEPMTVANQRENVRAAARAIVPVTVDNDVVISHGNGPQVGLLALQAESSGQHTPLDVLELQVLADLRRRKFSVARLRRLLAVLRDVFGVRLYEAIGDGGPMTLFIGGDALYARTEDGRLFNMEFPSQPLLMVGEELAIRPLTARVRKPRSRRGTAKQPGATRSRAAGSIE